MKCMYCGAVLRFNERGWVHAEGGGYCQCCPECGYRAAFYPAPVFCPKCGSSGRQDDHGAMPVRS
jgi:hypothetical protein